MTKFDPDALLRIMRSHPRAGSAELCRSLGGITRATLARWLAALGEQLLTRGGSRRTRYALRKALRGSLAPLPLYAIDESGRGHELGHLDLVHPEGSAIALREPFPWPLPDDSRDGWFDGLPYPLMDMRPQGFLGRNFAHRHAAQLAVAENPEAWTATDIVHVLATLGSDQPGNLILGEAAYRRFLQNRSHGAETVLSAAQLKTAYPRLAAEALAQGVVGSLAGGEFPKFTARRYLGTKVVDVIVKFSGADGSQSVRRWADLLVCEHLALETVARHLGVAAAESAVRRYAGRTFLELLRFDRHGSFGRSAVCTLSAINPALVGMAGSTWPRTAEILHAQGWLAGGDLAKICRIWWFGRLIANSDMHEGNLAFRPGLALAPIYDMLPMLYAPLRGGELPDRRYVPELPLPEESTAWRPAAEAASHYWERCQADPRISPAFRKICAENARVLARVRAQAL